jgi:hypothetical protein
LGSKRSRTESPPLATQNAAQSSLWSDDSQGLVGSDALSNAPLTKSQSTPDTSSTQLNLILEKLCSSEENARNRDLEISSKIARILDVVDQLTERNIQLEKALADLERRFNERDQNGSRSIDERSNDNLNSNPAPENQQLPPRASNPSTDSTRTWASIAQSPASELLVSANAKAKASVSTKARSAGMTALAALAAPRPSTRRRFSGTTAVYIGGFSFQKLRNIWAALKTARFQISRIFDIQWIGKTVLEFIVAQDYELQFVSELTTTNTYRVLDFDPTSNARAASKEQAETAMRSFAVRCAKNVIFNRDGPVRDHFSNLAEKAAGSNADLKILLEVEFERARIARDAEIEDIEGTLSVSDGEYSPEQIQSAKRLMFLVPTHSLAQQVLDSIKTSKSAQVDASASGDQFGSGQATSGW